MIKRIVLLLLLSLSIFAQNNTVTIKGYIDGCYPYWNNGAIESEIYLFSNNKVKHYFVKGGIIGSSLFYLNGFALPTDGLEGTFYIDTIFRAIRFIDAESVFTNKVQNIILDSIYPTTMPAGTNRILTLYGKNFGTIGKVKFYAGQGNYINAKDIITWDNNIIRCKIPVGVTARGFYGGANSGWVYVYNDSSYSNNKYINITYITKFKWPTTMSGYYYSPQLINVPAYQVLPAIGRGSQAWPGNFKFLYYGPRYPTIFHMVMNMVNEICFTDDIPSYMPAITYVYANSLTGDIIESDITFNVNTQWSISGEAGKLDLESTALHEFGHYLGLLDIEDKDKAMNNQLDYGSIRRVLNKWESQALIDIYGGTNNVIYKSDNNTNGVFPNPFNGSAIFNYTIFNMQYVNISIYNISGQKLMTLVDDKKVAGIYSIIVDLRGYASGTYYLKFNSGIYKLIYLR